MPHHQWSEYCATDFDNIDPDRTIAVLPTAAIEQHGPHLPVGVDTFINQGLLKTLLANLSEDIDLRLLPVQSIGKSDEHLYAPGTLTIPAELTIKLWVEIGLSVARTGIQKMVIINSHGGNNEVNTIVARELRARAGMLVISAHWSAFGFPEGLYTDDELTFGIHGGDIETSLMLYFRPDLVDMSKAENFRSSAQDLNPGDQILPTGSIVYGWIASDLSKKGVVGNAAIASAEKGRLTAEHQANGMARLLRELQNRQWP